MESIMMGLTHQMDPKGDEKDELLFYFFEKKFHGCMIM